MKIPYLPEIGQFCFGQPSQAFDCPDFVIAELERIEESLDERCDSRPFRNTGESFSNEVFAVEAYSWGDEPQPWNFKCGALEVSWYKWLGRGTSINRAVSATFARKMADRCIASLVTTEGGHRCERRVR